MKAPRIGALSELIRPAVVLPFLILLFCVFIFSGYRSWMDSSAGCVSCHANREEMKKAGTPWAYMTDDMVRKESRHPHIQCRDCHLGNGRAQDKGKAHKGMLRMLIVSRQGLLLERKDGYPSGIRETGDNRLFALLPKIYEDGEWISLPVRNILWHDRDPATLDFEPRIVEKTCAKAGCHPEELKQFRTSVMGRNHRQRTMRTWLSPYGPHNCGPSFADLPAKAQDKADFDYANTAGIQKEMNPPFSREQARDKQKLCNVCHAGCLDCHYAPARNSETGGVHTFSKMPTAESCSGYGRGNTICHPGAMHSRRGETYIGGDYSVPHGMPADVHYKKGLGCIQCHQTGEGGMGHIERKATCRDCHLEAEEAHSLDVHRNVDCAACHIKELRGYQVTVWGPGHVSGKESPFHKYLYYGTQSPPILIRDQKGVWMPVKVWPHSLSNVKADVPPSNGMLFRWKNGETRDAYFVSGTFSFDSKDASTHNKYLLWLEIEQAAHPYGPARDCTSCHRSSEQRAFSKWEFLDKEGSDPFAGKYTVEADGKGLRIRGLTPTEEIEAMPGYTTADFAPWLYFRDAWAVPGDFSITVNKEKYAEYYRIWKSARKKIIDMDARSGKLDKKAKVEYGRSRSFILHNPDEGLKRYR